MTHEMKSKSAVRIFLCLTAFFLAVNFISSFSGVAMAGRSAALDKALLRWPMMINAVKYNITINGGSTAVPRSRTYKPVYCPAIEVDLSWLGSDRNDVTWSVEGIDVDGGSVGAINNQPLSKAVLHPEAPLVFDEYAEMSYVPVYPVYSWATVLNASSYEVELWRRGEGGDKRVRNYYTYERTLYDETPLNSGGAYYWRVRALDGGGRRYSEWSEPREWVVTSPSPVVAIGDSLTHGGGAISVPPSMLMYCWESYSGVAIKNIGRSGDSTSDMIQRFSRDVLPFAPKVAVILGGVNDIRMGEPAGDVIANLSTLMNMCESNGITPVLVTIPPIEPERMARMEEIETPAGGWRSQLEMVNDWIRSQKYYVDVAPYLTDKDGNLKKNMTSDGLHPDRDAKKYIGETIGAYLHEKFFKEGRGNLKK